MLEKVSVIDNFQNSLINKRSLKNLMYDAFLNYGTLQASIIADRVKNLTFHYATQSGISLSVEDLRIPPEKGALLGITNNEVDTAANRFQAGTLTTVERYQKTVDIWNNANNFLKEDIVTYFRESDPLNPLYVMAFSGARGNISQVRQLVGMRGLMADPQGQIIDLPITSNFREGLSITEYIISSYGARKGLVDTALRTADSGYLTRRLVDVAQEIIVREHDCGTKEGLSENELKFYGIGKLNQMVGRLLAAPLMSESGSFLAPANTEITLDFINKFSNVNYKNLKIRSPLTCNSTRSVCRNCYGWHLSYSKLVDLGEAIGIIAAQSIGEPGTQLTMRTFHTGGVFSGDLNRHVRAPFPGRIIYSDIEQANLVRTIYGDSAFQLKHGLTLAIENTAGTQILFKLPPGSLLFKNNNEKVYTNEILASIQKEANLISEENQEDIFSTKTGEVFFQEIETEQLFDKQNNAYKVAKSSGLIWILQGDVQTLKNSPLLNAKPGLKLVPEKFLNQTPILSTKSGSLQLRAKDIIVKQFSVSLKNAFVENLKDNYSILNFPYCPQMPKFVLEVKETDELKNGDVIATLIDSKYKVKSGGIITYSLDNSRVNKKRKSVKTLFSGYCYFIPEEVYPTQKSSNLSALKFKTGDFVNEGTELLPNIFSKIDGYIFINEAEGEICIKPGELFDLKSEDVISNGTDRFVQPGEEIIKNKVVVQQLSYIQFFNFGTRKYMFVRPVETYEIPREKTLFLDQLFIPQNSKFQIQVKVVKRVLYKNWQRILPNNDLNIIKTSLVLELKNAHDGLFSKIGFKPSLNFTNKLALEVSLNEKIKLSNGETSNSTKKFASRCKSAITKNQYVRPRTLLTRLQASTKQTGVIQLINGPSPAKPIQDILILNSSNLRSISFPSDQVTLFVKVGDLVKTGTILFKDIKSPYSGQIYKITNQKIIIRLGQPVLISRGTILHVGNGSLIKTGDRLATLIYEKLKTTDIVQGLPKVEEILEARKIINTTLLAPCPGYAYLCSNESSEKYVQLITKNGESVKFKLKAGQNVKFVNGSFVDVASPLTDGIISPHSKLEILFSYYRKHYSNYEACKISFKYLQLFLVQEVQATYRSQGVEIDNKHIEIIVKQMTRKVSIEEGGSTTFLPGEVLNFHQLETIEKTAQLYGGKLPTYTPILLGLTKASLHSDSFISAASFQETTRVLTEAAIEGRKDWLNGLKENVIIGRLIPAGTGFDHEENKEVLKRETLDINSKVQNDFKAVSDNIRNLRE